MKKQAGIIFLLSFFLLFLAGSAIATEVNWPSAPLTGADLNEDSEFHDFIAYAYGWGIGIGGLLTFAMIVVGGFEWMISEGNPQKTGAAKNRIQSALLGLVLLLSSFVILNTINPQITKLRRLPPLWDTITFMSIMPDEETLDEPPCAFAVLYEEEDYQGASTGRLAPGKEYEEDFDYGSGKGYRQMTGEEALRFNQQGGGDTFDGKEVLDGSYVEGTSCALTLYYERGGWVWRREACGRVLTGVSLSSSRFEDHLQIDEGEDEDITCYTVDDMSGYKGE